MLLFRNNLAGPVNLVKLAWMSRSQYWFENNLFAFLIQPGQILVKIFFSNNYLSCFEWKYCAVSQNVIFNVCYISTLPYSAISSHFKSIQAISSHFQPFQSFPAISSNFQSFLPNPVFSSIFLCILGYSSLFQPIQACFSLFQSIPAYTSKYKELPQAFVPKILVAYICSF